MLSPNEKRHANNLELLRGNSVFRHLGEEEANEILKRMKEFKCQKGARVVCAYVCMNVYGEGEANEILKRMKEFKCQEGACVCVCLCMYVCLYMAKGKRS